MKLLLLIIIQQTAISVSAQTKFDSLLFAKINEYRSSKGISEVNLSAKAFNMANHHTNYLVKLNNDSIKTIVTHSEDTDINDFDETKSIVDRYTRFVGNNYLSLGENVAVAIKRKDFDDRFFVEEIFSSWKNSKKHNEIMLDAKYEYGGCSLLIIEKDFFSWVTDKKVFLKKCFATLNLYHK